MILTILSLPCEEARWRGVRPAVSAMLTSVPGWERRRRTRSVCPLCMARWRRVWPELEVLGSPPGRSSRLVTAAVFPSLQAVTILWFIPSFPPDWRLVRGPKNHLPAPYHVWISWLFITKAQYPLDKVRWEEEDLLLSLSLDDTIKVVDASVLVLTFKSGLSIQ